MMISRVSYKTNGPLVYMYITILVKQVYWYISQVSGERLQDHWSSGVFSSPEPKAHKVSL